MNALILDDEPLTAKLLKKLVQTNCYAVKKIEIRTNPIQVLNELPLKFDLLFIDIKMPQMSAFEFLKTAELPKTVPIIFTTAHEEFALEAFNANAIDYLVKPVSPSKLISAVDKAKRYIGESRTVTPLKPVLEKLKIYHDQEYILLNQNEIIHLDGSGW
jgi:two-component system LytT family response regulator